MFSGLLKGVFAVLAVCIGAGIIGWILYNEFVERQPTYQRPPVPILGLLLPVVMVGVGIHWGRQAIASFRAREQ